MYKRMPCPRCGGPKPPGFRKVCDGCKPIDGVWPLLEMGPGDCWLYTGTHIYDGYARFGEELIHRMVYKFLIVDLPADLDLDHLCLVKLCANPWHLEPVTRAENSKRRWAGYTHCPLGHELIGRNVYWRPDGARKCRNCMNRHQREYQARKREAVSG